MGVDLWRPPTAVSRLFEKYSRVEAIGADCDVCKAVKKLKA